MYPVFTSFLLASNNGNYHEFFSQNIGGSAKDFGYKSGKYSMELIVGDAVIENPISWPLVGTWFPS